MKQSTSAHTLSHTYTITDTCTSKYTQIPARAYTHTHKHTRKHTHGERWLKPIVSLFTRPVRGGTQSLISVHFRVAVL